MSLEETIENIVRRVVREELAAARPQATGMVTIKAFAAARSLSESTIRQAIRDGRLPAERFGRTFRVAADAQFSRRAATVEETTTARVVQKLGCVTGGRR